MEEPSYTSRRSLLNLIMGRVFGGAIGLSLARFRPAGAETVALPDGLSPPESAAVAAVIDGDTLRLANGETLRLAAIEAPKRDLAPGDEGLASLTTAATGALKALVAARPITLCLDAGKRDRYGRRLAQAFNSEGVWLQAALIGEGLARVHGDGRNRLGLDALLRAEAPAREAARGIWRHPIFALRAADDPKLDRFAGSFQIIEGRVFAAAIVKGVGFVNFGADRRTDLTLVLEKPVLDLGGPAMMDLAWLTSKPIRCRGWLDLYDGPRIDINHPEQIEVLTG
ncbi:thermonuclease family protein [Dongia sedimenti]|uniref:Thermonuclease family protein n=1 Tax=Dongia sedimenti TaxID=3064282 RepID=A0ABU0YNS4_9PROT|nr:thermonuclease family protein [Rhodospirillaceae bacterium R-7]